MISYQPQMDGVTARSFLFLQDMMWRVLAAMQGFGQTLVPL